MKKHSLIFLSLLSLTLIGCKKENTSDISSKPVNSSSPSLPVDEGSSDKNPSSSDDSTIVDSLTWPIDVKNNIKQILGEYTLPFYKATEYKSEILTADDGVTQCVSVTCLYVNENSALSSYAAILEKNGFSASTQASNFYFKDVSKLETQFIQYALTTENDKPALNIQSLVKTTRADSWPNNIINTLFNTQVSEVKAETYEYSWDFESINNQNYPDMPAMSIYCNGVSSNVIEEYKTQLSKDGFETSKVNDIDYALSTSKNIEISMYNYDSDVLYLSISKHVQDWPLLYLQIELKLEIPTFTCENVKYQTQYQDASKAYVIFCDNATESEYKKYAQSLIDSYNFYRFEDTDIETQGYCLYQGSVSNPTHQLQIVYSGGSDTQPPAMAIAIFA